MENPGKHIFTTPQGDEVYSTEDRMTSEERKKMLEEQQARDHAYSRWLLGHGPHPDEKGKEEDNNVVEFPGNKKDWDDMKNNSSKAA